MPAVGQLLSLLIIEKTAAKAKGLTGVDPRTGKGGPYFIAFCTAIGKSIADGTKVVMFTTKDKGFTGAPPVPGVGAGIGIKVDAEYMSEKMYTLLRDKAVAMGSKHGEWPPANDNGGVYLKCITDGICEGIKEHYKTCWILTSAHPLIYGGTGIINPELGSKFAGIQAEAIKSLIISNGTMMKGSMWPVLAECVAKAYKDGIENKSTGMVTIAGICVPSLSQVCGLPLEGDGTGAAA